MNGTEAWFEEARKITDRKIAAEKAFASKPSWNTAATIQRHERDRKEHQRSQPLALV